MEKIKNIKFGIDEGSVEFTFNIGETAYLQLPKTGDSQHQINGLDKNEWTDRERDICKQLVDYFYNQFSDAECYAASCELCTTIVHVEKVTYKHRQIFVAFDEENTAHLLVESAYKDYFNKTALFDTFNGNEVFGDEDCSESEIIEKARKQAGRSSND